jgi:hypothetical protein
MTVSNQSSRPDIPEGSAPAEPVDSNRDFIKPGKEGVMPLFDAVYWIASEGHTKAVDRPVWDDAVRVLIRALHGHRLPTSGTLEGTNASQQVPADDWLNVVGDRLNTEPYLLLIGPAGEHDRHAGMYQDQLFMVGQLQSSKWWRLAVKQSDIRKLWPFNLARSEDYHTLAASRQSTRQRAERGGTT